MVNILLEGFDIKAPWLYDTLKNNILPNHSVAIVAFAVALLFQKISLQLH